MRALTITFLVLAVFVAACGPVAIQDVVLDTDNEILYDSVVRDQVRSDEISYFGVSFGASEQDVRDLHGEPLVEEEYAFGRTRNLEYAFSNDNRTTVLYHFERGVLTSVLVDGGAEQVFSYDSLLGDERTSMYSVLGVPTRSEDLPFERMFIYDDLGYEVFTRKGIIDRIYFTAPDRGIEPVGRESNASNSTNSAPRICVQVITYAEDPQSGTCEEFPTPCDVPDGWDSCDPE